ncbi:MAG: metallophosphoesterase [Caldilineaceae bacterium]|nr:metallophosphoesterase [Caldilineaceae bacterium]
MKNSLLSRRRFLQLSGRVALSAAAALGYARLLEPNWVEVVEQNLAIPHLPEHLVGTRIAQLSDIHLGEYTGPEKLLDAVERVNRLAPDLVFLTGDYVTRTERDASGLVEPLRRLAAPTYAILGNHDLWTDRTTVTQALAETPAQLLVNRGEEALPGLFVAGVDDIWSGRPDVRAALADSPAGAVSLLLAHEPDYFDRVVGADAPVAVQFSGHSHGGQVRIPSTTPDGAGLWTRAPVLPRYGERYPIGLYRVGQRQVYTNRGLGVWPLPYRVNCRPEITIFRLAMKEQ